MIGVLGDIMISLAVDIWRSCALRIVSSLPIGDMVLSTRGGALFLINRHGGDVHCHLGDIHGAAKVHRKLGNAISADESHQDCMMQREYTSPNSGARGPAAEYVTVS